MERNFTNENFERFLRQNADGLRMRPSDKVWKGIHRQMNRKRRRLGFLLTFSLLITSALGYYLTEGNTPGISKTVQPSGRPASANNQLNRATPGSQKISNTQIENTKTAPPSLNLIASNQASGNSAFSAASSGLDADGSVEPGSSNSTVNDPVADLLTANTWTFQPTIVDEYPGIALQDDAPPSKETAIEATDPLSIESVMNSYQRRKKNSKLGLQFFFTPTVSYRRLVENKAYTRTSGNNFQQGVYNINNAVTHKPDFGFQVGLLGKYPVAKNVKLIGGLQFNINRYAIKTFNSSYEVATIQFRDRQTLNAVTSYNNFSGYKSDWLENFYFQIAAPVGIEMKISGNEKTQLGIATTIQPTYLIGDQAYLISKDYKAYMEVPWLVRHWNVNAGLETFVSYSTGKMKWQVGPQVRYQLLSTYDKKYPVKEHLFDFGLKVGVSLNKQ